MEKENVASKQLSDVISTLQKLAECPVCLDTVSPPARQCVNGHVTCAWCVTRLKGCSLCSKPFLEEKPTFVNNLLEALPRYCRYAKDGCKEIHAASNAHEDFCGFRSITCREATCGTKIKVDKMRDHYRVKHPHQFIIDKGNVAVSAKNFSTDSNHITHVPVFLDGNFFYLNKEFSTFEPHLRFTMEAFFVGKPKQEHFICISLTKGSFQFSKTIKLIVMKGDNDEDGFENLPETDKDDEEYHMHVTRASLLRVLDEGNLSWSVNFIKS